MRYLLQVLVLSFITLDIQAGDFSLLKQNTLIKTLPRLTKIWSLSVDIKPIGTTDGWSSIVHATIGNNANQYGDRVPGIWFHRKTSKLHICAPINGNINYIYNHPTPLPMNEFTNVKVEQTLEDQTYFYRIYVAGAKVHEVVNRKPSEFQNVKLFAADPWYNPAIAFIDQLKFDNREIVLTKTNLVKNIPTLTRSWSLSVDIRPLGTKPGWSNIVHATLGKNIEKYGDRVPGIWFHHDSTRLHICSAVNGYVNYIYDHPTALAMNTFTNVKVEQRFERDNFVYSIYITGQKVHEVVNSQASQFKDVKLYASDPWYDSSNADIDNLVFENEADPLERDTLVETISTVSKTWEFSVDIKPLDFEDGWASIVHSTIGGNVNNYGDRIPGIWFHHGSSRIIVCSAVNGNANYIYDHPTALPMNVFTTVKVTQTLENEKYFYRIYIAEKLVHEVENTKPSEFKDVKLYAGDPWYKEANAIIRNLYFENINSVLNKGTLAEIIPTLSKSWALSVDIKPLGTILGWSNIIHATVKDNSNTYGDRVPGIWFHSGSSRLHICSAINGRRNYFYNHPNALPLDVYTNVIVTQNLVNNDYVFSIYINGEKAHEVINKVPREFNNVKLYASDPWYKPANAMIQNLSFQSN